jgi:hypothetical protein
MLPKSTSKLKPLSENDVKNQYYIATLYTTQDAKRKIQKELDLRTRKDSKGHLIKDKLIITDTKKDSEVTYKEEEKELRK